MTVDEAKKIQTFPVNNSIEAAFMDAYTTLRDAHSVLTARIAELEACKTALLNIREWFRKHEFWSDEASEDLFPFLQDVFVDGVVLVEWTEFDPNKHQCDEAEPGDMIWWFPELPAPLTEEGQKR